MIALAMLPLTAGAIPMQKAKLPALPHFQAAVSARLVPLQAGIGPEHLKNLTDAAFALAPTLSADKLAARAILYAVGPDDAQSTLADPAHRERLERYIGSENVALLPAVAHSLQERAKKDSELRWQLERLRSERLNIDFELLFDGKSCYTHSPLPADSPSKTDPMLAGLTERRSRHFDDYLAIHLIPPGPIPADHHMNATAYAQTTLEQEMIGRREKKEFAAYIQDLRSSYRVILQGVPAPFNNRWLQKILVSSLPLLVKMRYRLGFTQRLNRLAISGKSELYEFKHALEVARTHLSRTDGPTDDTHFVEFMRETLLRKMLRNRLTNIIVRMSSSRTTASSTQNTPQINPAVLEREKMKIDDALATRPGQDVLYFVDASVLTNYAGTGRNSEGEPHPLASYLIENSPVTLYAVAAVENEFLDYVETLSRLGHLTPEASWRGKPDLITAAKNLGEGFDSLYIKKWFTHQRLLDSRAVLFVSRLQIYRELSWGTGILRRLLLKFLIDERIIPRETKKVHSDGDAGIIAEIMIYTLAGHEAVFAAFDGRLTRNLENARLSQTLQRKLRQVFPAQPKLQFPRPLLLRADLSEKKKTD